MLRSFAQWSGLFFLATVANAQSIDLRLDRVRESLTGTHLHYQQFIDGIEVVGGEKLESIELDGTRGAVFERVATRRSASSARGLSAPVRGAKLVYINLNGDARLAWRYVVVERPLEPYAVYVDAADGSFLHREALFFSSHTARVFLVNPVAALNQPSLQDQNDSREAVPEGAYRTIELFDLPESGPIAGPNVTIVDIEPPYTRRADVSQPLIFDRSQPEFEEVNAYAAIDRNQKYLQSLGYSGSRRIVGYSIPVDPHAANGSDNSYYIQSSVAGRGTLFFGDGGTDDAEDSDLILHEYGHAIQDWIAPGTFGGSSSSESRALGEGFGDYWAFSSTYAETIVSGRDPFCIADWDARCWDDDPSQQCGYPVGSDCLRRVDSRKTMADFIVSDSTGTEHRNGEIWSSALRETFIALVGRHGLSEGKRISDTIALESLFGTPPHPTFRAMALRTLAADRALRGGAEVALVCGVMAARGILPPGECGQLPRGELTYYPGSSYGVPIPDADAEGIAVRVYVSDSRPILRVAVHVDIAHPARGDLRIVLVAPNGARVVLKEALDDDRTPNIHATYGVDSDPASSLSVLRGLPATGWWELRVADIFASDVGSLLSWSLAIQAEGDESLTKRPAASGETQHIPVVAHVTGVNDSRFASDLYLLNRGSRDAQLTLIFTPSNADGRSQFGVVKAEIAPGQGVVFRDLVPQLFGTSGSGSLEIAGEVANVLAWSAIVNTTPNGTVGESIQLLGEGDVVALGDAPLYVSPVERGPQYRSNAGVTEIGGEPGTVRITLYDHGGRVTSVVDVDVLPFSHWQGYLPVRPGPYPYFAEIRVIRGGAKVTAYGSVVENDSGDPMFQPARRLQADTRVAPVVGSIQQPSAWMTEAWFDDLSYELTREIRLTPKTFTFFPASGEPGLVLAQTLLAGMYVTNFVEQFRVTVPVTGQVHTQLPTLSALLLRVQHPCDHGRGTCGQRVPLIPFSYADVPIQMDVAGVESSTALRTQIGMSEIAGAGALIRVELFDASGKLLGFSDYSLGAHQHVQFPLTSLYPGNVAAGHVRFEVIGGLGRVAGYASIVETHTGDPILVIAQ